MIANTYYLTYRLYSHIVIAATQGLEVLEMGLDGVMGLDEAMGLNGAMGLHGLSSE